MLPRRYVVLKVFLAAEASLNLTEDDEDTLSHFLFKIYLLPLPHPEPDFWFAHHLAYSDEDRVRADVKVHHLGNVHRARLIQLPNSRIENHRVHTIGQVLLRVELSLDRFLVRRVQGQSIAVELVGQGLDEILALVLDPADALGRPLQIISEEIDTVHDVEDFLEQRQEILKDRDSAEILRRLGLVLGLLLLVRSGTRIGDGLGAAVKSEIDEDLTTHGHDKSST